MSHRIRKTILDGSNTLVDPIDVRDITGNGLADIVWAENDGRVYWLSQTSQGVFSAKLTINGSTIPGASCEGVMFIKVDAAGDWNVIVCDQSNHCLYIYTMDVPNTPTGTWTRTTLLTGRNGAHDCRAWDIDNDGQEEIVYTHHDPYGGAGSGSAVRWLKYNGGGVTSIANYSQYLICEKPFTHMMVRDRLTINGNAGCIAFSARVFGGTSGFYYATPASPVTNTWAVTTIYQTTDGSDWTHIDYGDFFGNGNIDFVIQCNNVGGTSRLAVLDAANAYAITVLSSGSVVVSQYNCFRASFQWRNRDAVIASGTTSLSIWEWDGTTWQKNDQIFGHDKADGKFFALDLDGDGQDEYLCGSDTDILSFKIYQQAVAPAAGYLDSLIAVYKCDDDAGANLADSYTNALHLTQSNSPGSTTGKVGNARTFATNKFANRADDPLFSMGSGQSYTGFGWARMNVINANMEIVQKVNATVTAAGSEYRWRFGQSSKNFLHYVSNGTTSVEPGTNVNTAQGGAAIVAGIFYWCAFGYNARTGMAWVKMDDRIPTGIAHTLGAQNGTNDFGVGGDQQFMNGDIDQLFLYKREFNDEELREVYTQQSAGNDFPSLTAAKPHGYYSQQRAS